MSTVIDRTVEKITEKFITGDEAKELERMAQYRLSDAIKEGSAVSNQAIGSWSSGDNLCAMSAAVCAAKARGYMA